MFKTIKSFFGTISCVALPVALFLAGFMLYATYEWRQFDFSIPPIPGKRAIALLILLIPFVILCKKRLHTPPSPLEKTFSALTLGLAIYLFSIAASHPWFFIAKWFAREGAVSSAEVFSIATSLLSFTLLLLPQKRHKIIFISIFATLFLTQILSFRALIRITNLAPLYRDDHPSFLMRIHEFCATYPHLVDFTPWWNGGVVNSVTVSSGIGAIAIPFFPLFKIYQPHEVYTLVFGIVFILIMPYLTYLGLRTIGTSKTASAIGAILTIASTRYFYLWCHHFGTIGASASISFLPLFACLIYKTLILHKTSILTLISLSITTFFLFQWPPCIIMAATFALGLLANIRYFNLKSALKVAASLLVTALLLLPNIIAILESRELLSYVAQIFDAPKPILSMFIHTLTHRLPELNPCLLFYGIPSLFFLRNKAAKRLFALPVFALFIISVLGPHFAPNMQLERMILPAFILLIIPTALFVEQAISSANSNLALTQSVIITLLFLSGLTVTSIYKERSYAPFSHRPFAITDFEEAIKANVPADSRLLFLGRTVHSFGGGHVAYLPISTGREMLACDYYHFPRGMVEYNYPPSPWRETPEGIAAFMRHYGATHLATALPEYNDFIASSGLFTEIPYRKQYPKTRNYNEIMEHAMARVHLYKLNDAISGKFLQGSGTIEADNGYLKVTPSEANCVVRYNYSTNLTATNGEIYPVEIAPGITFIGIRAKIGSTVTIKYGEKR